MSNALQRLIREWIALVAILAMALGPLALGVSRSLAAQERVLVAAGLSTLPLCQHGDMADGLGTKTGGGACDHCSAALNGPPLWTVKTASDQVFVAQLQPLAAEPLLSQSQLWLPPSTGPPTA